MELGVCMAAKVDDVDYAVLAEELGYRRVWVADSPMIWSDCYATMALIARATSRIGIGTGVAVAGIRIPPVTAAAHATINRLAPGRVFCGMGSGNTAMRILGRKPMRIAAFEEYLRELRPLLAGEEAMLRQGEASVPTRHLMADAGFVDFAPPIPLYVSGFGPKAMGLAGAHGDGLVLGALPSLGGMERVWEAVEAGAAAAGRTIDRSAFHTCVLTTMVVLEPGEPADSRRVREEAGAFAMASLHYAYEQWSQYGVEPRPVYAAVWDDYVAMLAREPEERRHLRIHRGHNCWVEPEEERFVTPEVVQGTCLVGTPEQLAERLRRLAAAGLSEVMLLPPLAVKEKVLRDVAEQVMPLLAEGRPAPA